MGCLYLYIFLSVELAFSPSFHGGMPFCLLRLIDATAFTFTTVRTGLATVDDPPFFKGIVTNVTTTFGAYLICHFHFLLLILILQGNCLKGIVV